MSDREHLERLIALGDRRTLAPLIRDAYRRGELDADLLDTLIERELLLPISNLVERLALAGGISPRWAYELTGAYIRAVLQSPHPQPEILVMSPIDPRELPLMMGVEGPSALPLDVGAHEVLSRLLTGDPEIGPPHPELLDTLLEPFSTLGELLDQLSARADFPPEHTSLCDSCGQGFRLVEGTLLHGSPCSVCGALLAPDADQVWAFKEHFVEGGSAEVVHVRWSLEHGLETSVFVLRLNIARAVERWANQVRHLTAARIEARLRWYAERLPPVTQDIERYTIARLPVTGFATDAEIEAGYIANPARPRVASINDLSVEALLEATQRGELVWKPLEPDTQRAPSFSHGYGTTLSHLDGRRYNTHRLELTQSLATPTHLKCFQLCFYLLSLHQPSREIFRCGKRSRSLLERIGLLKPKEQRELAALEKLYTAAAAS